MEDFENIARRTSALDTLYDDRRALVRHCVVNWEVEKREMLRRESSPPSVRPFAVELGTMLNAAARFALRRVGYSTPKIRYHVGGNSYTPAGARTSQFWENVVAESTLTVADEQNGYSTLFTGEELEELFPDLLNGRWRERNLESARVDAAALDEKIADLRGADFQRLVQAADIYKMPSNFSGVGGPGTVSAAIAAEMPAADTVSMADLVHMSLSSELARDLVRRGYIDMNFSVYAAQFYGAFAGIDVHTFLIQTEQTNGCDIDYKFDSEDSVQHLLDEAGADFTHTLSAFNIDILDWLLVHDPARAANVASHLVSTHETSDIARQFMATYLTSGKVRAELAALLARQEWRSTFTHLAASTEVPEDARIELVDAALRATRSTTATAYDIPAEVLDFLVGRYQQMPAFTAPQSAEVVAAIVALLKGATVRLPDLAVLDAGMRKRIVAEDLYVITAGNLRLAARIEGLIDLDHLMNAAPDTVYRYCLSNLDAYSAEVANDAETAHTIGSAQTLQEVLSTDAAGGWSSKSRDTLLAATSSVAVLEDIQAVPVRMWEALAEAGLFRATLSNIGAYLHQIGSIDTGLGKLLAVADAIITDTRQPGESKETEDAAFILGAHEIAVAILNARETIPLTEQRVKLAASLELNTPLAAADIVAENSDLFALLLRAGLVADDESTFSHLITGGWPAARAAIIASDKVSTFLTPAHIAGLVPDVLGDHDTAEKVGELVLDDLDSFVEADDQLGWTAVAELAARKLLALGWEHLRQVAEHSTGDARQTLQLLELANPSVDDIPQVLGVLELLGEPWSFISTREKAQFDAPGEPPSGTFLGMLSALGVVKLGRLKKDGNQRVTLL